LYCYYTIHTSIYTLRREQVNTEFVGNVPFPIRFTAPFTPAALSMGRQPRREQVNTELPVYVTGPVWLVVPRDPSGSGLKVLCAPK